MNTIVCIIVVVLVVTAIIAILVFVLLRRRRKSREEDRLSRVTGDRVFAMGADVRDSVVITDDKNVLGVLAAKRKARQAQETAAKLKSKQKFFRKYKISVAHPKLLSKGYASLLVVQIYLPSARSQAKSTITKEFKTQKVKEHVRDIELEKGLKIRLKLFSPVLSFSDSIIKQIENGLTIARFTVIPNDDCQPGTHYAVLSITDAETHFEYESISFVVKVVDFAFDHVSRPLLSKAISIVMGLGSLIMFVLTALEQVDKTVGLTAGTAAAVLTSTILIRFWLLFQQPKVTHEP